MRMQKVQFRIGQLAKQLNVEKFVIRFWEKEFALPTARSNGGQRFYSQEDLEQFKLIKTLLYDQGFTIAGAKKQLEETVILGSHKTTIEQEKSESSFENFAPSLPSLHLEQLKTLRAQLIKLQTLL